MEAIAECIPTKLRAKRRIPWETLAIRKKKQVNLKTASLCCKRNPTNASTQKFMKAQRELINAEQIEYIQGQIFTYVTYFSRGLHDGFYL